MKVNNVISLYFNNIQNSNTVNNISRETYPNLKPLKADIVSFGMSPKALAKKVSIFSGRANPALTEAIEKKLGLSTGKKNLKNFSDGETYVRLMGDMQGKDVYLVQPSADPVNDSIMELFFMIDAAKRADAKRVIAVTPYMGYERQDRKAAIGEPIAAKLHAKLLQAAGADKVIAVDLHSSQIEGFFENTSNVVHISAITELAKYIKSKNLEDLVVVSPDAGGAKRAELLAESFDSPYAVIQKKREKHNEAKAVNLYGDVAGKNCILFDDMIDTAGSIVEATRMLKEHGAKDVYVCASHGVFSGPAYERLENSPVKEVIVTNTLPLKENAPSKITQIDISSLIADAIKKLSI
ncbi:MAG: ribose-phosphate pyrophosphokinase [Candidatus Gastranaerophilaceae bacterium]